MIVNKPFINSFSGCLFLSPILLFITILSSCSMSSMLYIEHHSDDSTKFEVKPIPFEAISNEVEDLSVQFYYNRTSKKQPLVMCKFQLKNNQERMALSGIAMRAEGVDYFASTYDYPKAQLKGKDEFVHTITLFVPELDFQKMTESNSIVLEIDGSKFKISEKKWAKAKEEIKEKNLLIK